jgi:PPK2 family polyphosphate:nucleotide phosphotransferase
MNARFGLQSTLLVHLPNKHLSEMVRLRSVSCLPPAGLNKDHVQEQARNYISRIGEMQQKLYAGKKQAILVVLQGMDGSGKDSTTNSVFSKCSVAGIEVHNYKKPTEEEFSHDFLWRIHKNAPAKGKIGVFVRSHYEDILVQRVHKWIDEERVSTRIDAINAFENLLSDDNETIILKFYLHISKEEQKRQLTERIDDPEKRWKHNDEDWKERKLWPEYMDAYEDMINRSEIEWTIVPADKHWYRDYVVARKVCEAMEKLHLKYPEVDIKIKT